MTGLQPIAEPAGISSPAARHEELAQLREENLLLKTQRDAALSRAASIEEKMNLLEGFAGVRGIDASQVVHVPLPGNKTVSRGELERMSHSERNAFFAQSGRIEG